MSCVVLCYRNVDDDDNEPDANSDERFLPPANLTNAEDAQSSFIRDEDDKTCLTDTDTGEEDVDSGNTYYPTITPYPTITGYPTYSPTSVGTTTGPTSGVD